jgi:hypothetical protein
MTKPRLPEQEGPHQPDPMLRRGRASHVWIWAVAVIVVAVVGVLFAVMNTDNRPEAQNRTAPYQGPPVTTGSSTPPQPAQPSGRNDSSVPLTGAATPAPAR